MALLPYHDLEYPWYMRRARYYDWDWDYAKEHFGDGFTPEEMRALMNFSKLGAGSSWRYWPPYPRPALGREVDKTTTGKDGFRVCLDVLPFKRYELSVRTISDTIIIEGKHDEHKNATGYISRHFTRKYTLPRTFDSRDLTATLSSDGVLTVKAPFTRASINNIDRIVYIKPIGPTYFPTREFPSINRELSAISREYPAIEFPAIEYKR